MIDNSLLDLNGLFALILGFSTFLNIATIVGLRQTRQAFERFRDETEKRRGLTMGELTLLDARLGDLSREIKKSLTTDATRSSLMLPSRNFMPNSDGVVGDDYSEMNGYEDSIDTLFDPPVPYRGMGREKYREYVRSQRKALVSSDSPEREAQQVFDMTTGEEGARNYQRYLSHLADLPQGKEIPGYVEWLEGTELDSRTEEIISKVFDNIGRPGADHSSDDVRQSPFFGLVKKTGTFVDLRPPRPTTQDDVNVTGDVWGNSELPGLLPRPVLPPKRTVEKPKLRTNQDL